MANLLAYGFVGQEHLFSERVADLGIEVTNRMLDESLAEWNRSIQNVLSNLVDRTTDYTRRILLPGTGTLQPIDQWGNPLPTRPGGFFDQAFPIQGAGDAFGTNRITRAQMTVEYLNRHVVDVQMRDADWLRRHVLAAIFTNVDITYEDLQYGALTVHPGANGDAQVYNRQGGVAASTDNHFAAQTAAIADATNPFPTIYTELTEHPSNAGKTVVAFVPSANIADVRGLSDFVPVADPDVQPGDDTPTLRTQIGASFGDRVHGKVDEVWIVEWLALPANYIVAFALGGGGMRPLVMREYPQAELQGLFREAHNVDGNRLEDRWLRYCGFAVQDRTSFFVQQVEGDDATYDIPTGYTAPLPI